MTDYEGSPEVILPIPVDPWAPEPSQSSAPVEEATMAMSVDELFADDED